MGGAATHLGASLLVRTKGDFAYHNKPPNLHHKEQQQEDVVRDPWKGEEV